MEQISVKHSLRGPTVCYICSAARSGSTMLDLLIGGHSAAASLGEFSFLGKALALAQDCTCGASVSACTQWCGVLQRVLTERNIDLQAAPYALEQWDTRASTVIDPQHQNGPYLARRRLGSVLCDLRYASAVGRFVPLLPHLRQGVRNAEYLYATIAAQWRKSLLVDSSKNVHKALALHEQLPNQIRVLYLTRDGRGVYHSRRSSGFSQREAASGWVNYNRRAQRLLTRNLPPEHLLHVRYEELVAQPELYVEKICAFLGLPPEPQAMLRLSPANAHLVNGNDMRFKGDQQMRLDQRWKTELDAAELGWFQANDDGMNARLGY